MTFTNTMVVIQTDGVLRKEALMPDDQSRLSQFQQTVDGWIETIRLHDQILMVLNEEGAINRLPPNPRATALLDVMGAKVNMMGGMLFGNVILVGYDESPETVGLPQWFLDELPAE